MTVSESRRGLLVAAATAVVPSTRLRAMPAEPDVIIVGAGAAGIGAARELLRAGASCVLLEALDRVGGRAWTDTATFGVPFDRGASWLHSADRNPWTAMARHAGRQTVDHDGAEVHYVVDGRPASRSERARARGAERSLGEALDGCAERGVDGPLGADTPAAGWAATARHGEVLSQGADLHDVSCIDASRQEAEEPNRLVRGGLGTLVAAHAAGLPVELSTPVRAIRWGGGNGVRVESTRGSLRARAVIVTVSTGVLAKESIAFDPPLPQDKQDAIAGLPQGLLLKVALQCDGGLPYGGPGEWIVPRLAGSEGFRFLNDPFGSSLVIGFTAGRHAWALSRAGDAQAVSNAVDALVAAVGGSVRSRVRAGSSTRWGEAPSFLGSYSHARPGHAAGRARLARPVEDRLFFAGEACHERFAATVAGALLSGRDAAQRCLAAMGRSAGR